MDCIVHGVTKSCTWLSDFWGFPCSSAGKESTCNAGDPDSILGSESSPGEGIGYPLQYPWASLVAQTVKGLPVMWETWVWSLGWEDPLEEGRATHSGTLSWRIPMDRGAWWATVYGVTKSWTWLSDETQHTAWPLELFPSINMAVLRFTHFVACSLCPAVLTTAWYSIVWMNVPQFSYLC